MTTKFKETEIGTIPEEWNVVSLTEIVDVIGGGTPKTSESSYWNGNIPWLSVVDFNNDSRKVYTTEKFITDDGLKNSSTKVLKKGALVISARGTVGALTQLGVDMAFNQSCYGLVAKSISNDLLYYIVKNVVADIKKRTHGSVFDTITRETLDGINLGLPTNVSEQKQIAEILSSLDDKIELNRQINANLEKIASSLFKHWFVDFEFPDKNSKPYKSSGGKMIDSELGEIPEGWKVAPISSFGNVVCGKTPLKSIKEYFDGNIPFIKIPDMHGNIFVIKTIDGLTKEGMDSQKNKTIPSGSICVSCIATVGLVSMTIEDSQTNQQINSIVPEKSIYQMYLFYVMKNIEGILQRMGSSGSATLNVNTKSFSSIDILRPDSTILGLFDDIIRPIFDQIKLNMKESLALSQVRDSLLPRLMNGKIRIK